ncbi:diacylglycerol kinase family protein [Robertmurraya korlensis]|uniref:diacylglycerol kinase family protein n=1 Tax=Robertmurraya korlensis TaxID=519977 RepID=UPI0008254C05|nr:diacylglycerol kinase family protein [Robertmurraya korlensis]
MSMGSGDNRKFKTINVLYSFRHAVSGFSKALKEERNMKIHLFFTVAVVFLGFVLEVTKIEWILLLLLIGGVISLELINSSIENLVDLVTEEFHPLAKKAKDMAAAAVFFLSIVSVIIGLIIFIPKVW